MRVVNARFLPAESRQLRDGDALMSAMNLIRLTAAKHEPSVAPRRRRWDADQSEQLSGRRIPGTHGEAECGYAVHRRRDRAMDPAVSLLRRDYPRAAARRRAGETIARSGRRLSPRQ